MLKEKVVFIAGACGRIGKALSRAVLEQGGGLAAADIDTAGLERLKAELGAEFGTEFLESILALPLDITDKEGLNLAFEKAACRLGKIDGFVNASYPPLRHQRPYYELEFGEICENLNVHLGGFILASQEAVKFFKKQGWGNIINFSSIMGVYAPKFENYQGTTMQSSLEYSVIKAGINHLGKWLAKELFNTNIRVNTLACGGILDAQPQNFLEAYRACCASKGMLEPGDVCGTAVFLLSDLSMQMTGQTLVVDDGWGL